MKVESILLSTAFLLLFGCGSGAPDDQSKNLGSVEQVSEDTESSTNYMSIEDGVLEFKLDLNTETQSKVQTQEGIVASNKTATATAKAHIKRMDISVFPYNETDCPSDALLTGSYNCPDSSQLRVETFEVDSNGVLQGRIGGFEPGKFVIKAKLMGGVPNGVLFRADEIVDIVVGQTTTASFSLHFSDTPIPFQVVYRDIPDNISSDFSGNTQYNNCIAALGSSLLGGRHCTLKTDATGKVSMHSSGYSVKLDNIEPIKIWVKSNNNIHYFLIDFDLDSILSNGTLNAIYSVPADTGDVEFDFNFPL